MPAADPGCVFCAIAAGRAPAAVLAREAQVMALLDIDPVARGHALVIPLAHAATLGELDAAVRGALFDLAHRVLGALRRCGLPCAGANLVVNDGGAANQSIPHVHVHVVPRTPGDTRRLAFGLARRACGRFARRAPQRQLEALAAAIGRELAAPADRPGQVPEQGAP